MGASAAGGSTRDYVNMLRKAAGAQFELVTGYKGTAEIGLAVERGEVDGLCGWDWSSLKAQKSDWLRDKKVNILLQLSLEPEAELTKMGVPPVWQFIKNDDDKKAVELVVSQQVFGRPFVAPPGTNPDAVKILREAFAAAMKDKDLLGRRGKGQDRHQRARRRQGAGRGDQGLCLAARRGRARQGADQGLTRFNNRDSSCPALCRASTPMRRS